MPKWTCYFKQFERVDKFYNFGCVNVFWVWPFPIIVTPTDLTSRGFELSISYLRYLLKKYRLTVAGNVIPSVKVKQTFSLFKIIFTPTYFKYTYVLFYCSMKENACLSEFDYGLLLIISKYLQFTFWHFVYFTIFYL